MQQLIFKTDAINSFPDGKATMIQGQQFGYLLWPNIVASFIGICTPEEWIYRKYLISVHTSSTLIWRSCQDIRPTSLRISQIWEDFKFKVFIYAAASSRTENSKLLCFYSSHTHVDVQK